MVMKKQELEFYVAPKLKVLELRCTNAFLQGSIEDGTEGNEDGDPDYIKDIFR